ncbi:MAG TPA: M20/M25/M40 family metallo-hydrolase [Haliangium sp.]|nr:M20/M25/M40 family metallo-hydrolase [Haliangium sp.]
MREPIDELLRLAVTFIALAMAISLLELVYSWFMNASRRPVLMPRIAAAAAVLVPLGLVLLWPSQPTPRAADAAPGEFSAGRAMAHVQTMAVAPRPVGSDHHARTRSYLLATLRDLGLEVEVQEGTGTAAWPGGASVAPVANVIATLPGTAGGGDALVLAAHYDTVPASPGASDDAVGVATLLEVARALAHGPRPARDVAFLLSDGEEIGLLGARLFARAHPLASRAALVMNLEARGTHGPVMMFETTPGNQWSIEQLAQVGGAFATSVADAAYELMPNDTDLSALGEPTLDGMNFAFIDGASRYHTPGDDIDSVDARTLQQLGDVALGLARRVGDTDLAGARAQAPEVVFFDVLGHLVHYPAAWALPLALAGLALAASLLIRDLRRGRVRVARLARAAAALLAGAVAAAVAVALAWMALAAALGEAAVGPSATGPLTLGFFALATAVVGLVTRLLLRPGPAQAEHTIATELYAGAATALAPLALAVAALMPTASYLPLASLLGVCLAWLASAASAPDALRPGRAAAWGLSLAVLSSTWGAIAVPLHLALSMSLAGPIALLLALFVVPVLLPLLDFVAGGRRKAVVSASVLAAFALGAGAVQARLDAHGHSASVPAVEVVDTGTGVRRVIDTRHTEDEWALFLGWLRPPPPLDAPLAQLGSGASSGAMPDGPGVQVVSDARTGDGRRIALDVTTAAGSMWSSLELGPRAQLRALTLDQAPLDVDQMRTGSGERVVIEHWAPERQVRLQIDVAVDVPVVLRVSELHWVAGQRPTLVTRAWSF